MPLYTKAQGSEAEKQRKLVEEQEEDLRRRRAILAQDNERARNRACAVAEIEASYKRRSGMVEPSSPPGFTKPTFDELRRLWIVYSLDDPNSWRIWDEDIEAWTSGEAWTPGEEYFKSRQPHGSYRPAAGTGVPTPPALGVQRTLSMQFQNWGHSLVRRVSNTMGIGN